MTVEAEGLEGMVAQGEWAAVREECERLELEGRGDAAVLLLAHLLLDDLPSARLVWKRAAEEERRVGGGLALAWEVAQHIGRRQHSPAHRAIAALYSAAGPAAATARALTRVYRERTFALLCKAYANIPLSQCASSLGLSYADCKEYVAARGWECGDGDGGDALLVVRQQERRKQQTVGLAQLRQLVEYSVFLEA